MSKNSSKSLQKSMRFLLLIGQIFGFFPLTRTAGDGVSGLLTSWWSLQVLRTAFMGIVAWLGTASNIRFMIVHGFQITKLGSVLFNFCNGSHFFSFIALTHRWPQLMGELGLVEAKLAKYGWPEKFDRNVKIFSIVFLLMELGEHLSQQIGKIVNAISCTKTLDGTLTYFFKRQSYPHIFEVVPYSHLTGIILQVVNTSLSCCWTYVDVFIIQISIYMSARFKQIGKQVKNMTEAKSKSTTEWGVIRKDYNALCRVCRTVNTHLSTLVFVSFFTNIYFVITGLFLGVGWSRHFSLFLFLNFSLLVLRTVSVCWFVSYVHEESKRPFRSLLASRVSNIEVDRFIDVLRFTNIAITGMDLFRITKSLVLTIMGAVLTYQLILMQFVGFPRLVTHFVQGNRTERYNCF